MSFRVPLPRQPSVTKPILRREAIEGRPEAIEGHPPEKFSVRFAGRPSRTSRQRDACLLCASVGQWGLVACETGSGRTTTVSEIGMISVTGRSERGLKQASRSWNQRFDKVIKNFGFIQTYGEACVYKKVSGSSIVFLVLYVDDILLIGNDIELLESVKGYLNNSFSMKDLGKVAYILGIKIYRD